MNVRIYSPSKSVTQSGLAKTAGWVLEYELSTARLPEALMGWASSGDTNNQVRLRFKSLDEAIAHAEREGWTYSVQLTQERKIRARNYVDNFKYRPPSGKPAAKPAVKPEAEATLPKEDEKKARPKTTKAAGSKADTAKKATAEAPAKKPAAAKKAATPAKKPVAKKSTKTAP